LGRPFGLDNYTFRRDMNTLITSSLKEGDLSALLAFPRELLSSYEQNVIDFIVAFKIKHKEVPTVERLQEEFDFFVPIYCLTGSPLTDLFESVLHRKTLSKIRSNLNVAMTELDDGKVPGEMLRESVKLMTAGGDIDRLSKFDRSRYFRSGRIFMGLSLIDEATGGISDGEVMIIAGRLGTGKSTLSHYVAYNWWKAGLKVLYVSAEMLTPDIFSRIDGFIGKFNPRVFRSESASDLTAKIISKVKEETDKEEYGEIIVPTMRHKTPDAIFSMAQDLEVDAVIIDGIYLLETDGRTKTGSNWERVLAISNQIKQNAISSRLPVLTVTQIKRNASNKGTSAVYDAEDLAYSDGLAQDADFVIAIRPDDVEPELVELQLIKNRFGRTTEQMVKIEFDNMTVIDMGAVLLERKPRLAADGTVLSAW
jgi:KaiC/GvpD/RAD55 family RecA-like ATPase